MIRRCGVAVRVLFTEPNIEDCVLDTAIRIATALHQMDLILASVYFRNSKRYPVLFRYIVVAAVEGRADALKERTLGVAVFQRSPDYDTNSDPIVRITAGEIRKRIAQYYHEPGHEHELLIASKATPGTLKWNTPTKYRLFKSRVSSSICKNDSRYVPSHTR